MMERSPERSERSHDLRRLFDADLRGEIGVVFPQPHENTANYETSNMTLAAGSHRIELLSNSSDRTAHSASACRTRGQNEARDVERHPEDL